MLLKTVRHHYNCVLMQDIVAVGGGGDSDSDSDKLCALATTPLPNMEICTMDAQSYGVFNGS